MSQFQENIAELVKELLQDIPIKVEIPIQKIFPSYPSGKERYDLIIPSLKIIIESHGQQHETFSTFGEKDLVKAKRNFELLKYRDSRKEELAWENGWGYIIIWYYELLEEKESNLLMLKNKLMEAIRKRKEPSYGKKNR